MRQRSGWQLSGNAPEAYKRYIIPACMGAWAQDLVDVVAVQAGRTRARCRLWHGRGGTPGGCGHQHSRPGRGSSCEYRHAGEGAHRTSPYWGVH
jgi:hypothetical protein